MPSSPIHSKPRTMSSQIFCSTTHCNQNKMFEKALYEALNDYKNKDWVLILKFDLYIFKCYPNSSFYWFQPTTNFHLKIELLFHSFKAKLLFEAMFFIIIFLTRCRYTGPKWSTWKPSSIHFRHKTSLLRLHG